jgi:hypothetical protein
MSNGKTQGHPQPIHIKFEQNTPVDSVKIGEDYLLHIEWKNRDNRQSYDGYFVIQVSLENRNVESFDLECSYEGQVIDARVTDTGLEYHLPIQSFQAHEVGYDEISISYNKPGKYNLDIAIAQG